MCTISEYATILPPSQNGPSLDLVSARFSLPTAQKKVAVDWSLPDREFAVALSRNL
jgi:hypothetical protein